MRLKSVPHQVDKQWQCFPPVNPRLRRTADESEQLWRQYNMDMWSVLFTCDGQFSHHYLVLRASSSHPRVPRPGIVPARRGVRRALQCLHWKVNCTSRGTSMPLQEKVICVHKMESALCVAPFSESGCRFLKLFASELLLRSCVCN